MKAKSIIVSYRGHPVGELRDFGDRTGFQYDRDFLDSAQPLSPIDLPLQTGVFERSDPDLHCLPGIFSDALPDSYGRRILRDWYSRHMGPDYPVTAADMLSYVGQNGMGALCFEPAREQDNPDALIAFDLARARNVDREYAEGDKEKVIDELRRQAKTVGGTFPKALMSIDPQTGTLYETRPGLPAHFEHWIIKFGVGSSRQPGNLDNYPEIEAAYLDMARDCGIIVPEVKLFLSADENGNQLLHLGVRRFDLVQGVRLHYGSLSGLLGRSPIDDYWDYRHLLEVTEKVVADFRAMREQCLRMMFNLASGNWDDHAKNHGFLYNGKAWSLAPAFDLSFWGHRPNGTPALALMGRIRDIKYDVISQFCERIGLPAAEVRTMASKVQTVLTKADNYLVARGVPDQVRSTVTGWIQRNSMLIGQ